MRKPIQSINKVTIPSKLQIIALGGAGDIGKNMLAFRYEDDLFVVDAGVQFPNEEQPGVDLIIPDFTYLRQNSSNLRAIVLTHAHEDHIGALPYLLRELTIPVYSTRLTLGLVRMKCEEHRLPALDLREITPGQMIEIGSFQVEAVRVTHSIPDTVSLAVHSPVGTIVHTGDFKIDASPIDGKHFDAQRFAELGDQGVLLLISDSVNAEKKGWVPSESFVGTVFDREIRAATGRVFVTTFASNIHRVQQVFDTAARYGRKVAVAGRSMVRNIEVASELGYLNMTGVDRIKVEQIDDFHPAEVIILTTGSQGEPLSGLTRMSRDDHKIQIMPGDTVILSSTPIPGNEDAIWRTVNRLFRRGARVIYDLLTPVHASGHANQEELKMMLNLTRPKYIIPYHGEPRHIFAYTEMAVSMGISTDRILPLEIGDVLELDHDTAAYGERVPAGSVLVDGVSSAGVSEVILRDRRHLSQDGTVVVTLSLDRNTGEVLAGPELISRGFLHPEDSEGLFEEARTLIVEELETLTSDAETGWDEAQSHIREVLVRFFNRKTRRRPVVIPVISEI